MSSVGRFEPDRDNPMTERDLHNSPEDRNHAVRSVRGLQGWVGVDFFREASDSHLIVLEINPRPTTSLVGILARYPQGAIAKAWLQGALEGKFQQPEIKRFESVRFVADGTILNERVSEC